VRSLLQRLGEAIAACLVPPRLDLRPCDVPLVDGEPGRAPTQADARAADSA